MKKLFTLAFLLSTTINIINAQDKTTVTATTSEISDNLDLRAIATLFGEASNLEDFEKKINDPKAQISNLDLNEDNYVDYLRVIESVEDNVHLIIIQSVIEKDKFQDVASIEVQKDKDNNVQVQVVGDVYMYGQNYIYEPVYVHTPIIYSTFWITNYSPYCSTWYWNYYPSYYYYWNPFPVFRYRNHINVYIGGYSHIYNYVNYRRCSNAYSNYYGRRANAYETRYPDRSFTRRNTTVSNRYELDNTRNTRTVNQRENGNTNPRIEGSTRTEGSVRSEGSTRSEASVKTQGGTRSEGNVRTETPTRSEGTVKTQGGTRSEGNVRTETPTRSEGTVKTQGSTRNEGSVRSDNTQIKSNPNKNSSIKTETPRNTSTPKAQSSSRNSSPKTGGNLSRSGGTSRSSNNGGSGRSGSR